MSAPHPPGFPAIDLQLRQAVAQGDAEAIERLIISGANPNATTGWGDTMLMSAIEDGNIAGALALIERSNLTHKSLREWSALGRAAQKNLAPVLRALLERPEILADSDDLNEALRVAAGRGNVEALRLLLPLTDPRSASTEVVFQDDSGGWTALHLAARAGSLECCQLLLDKSDVERRSPYGLSCWDEALSRGFNDLAAWLLQAHLSKQCSEDLERSLGVSDAPGALDPNHAPPRL